MKSYIKPKKRSFKNMWKDFKEYMTDFLKKAQQEIGETKEAGIILKKYASGHKLTKNEKKLIKLQTYDILKSVGIGVPFALIPGSAILLPIIIRFAKKRGIHVLPSAFESKK